MWFKRKTKHIEHVATCVGGQVQKRNTLNTWLLVLGDRYIVIAGMFFDRVSLYSMSWTLGGFLLLNICGIITTAPRTILTHSLDLTKGEV